VDNNETMPSAYEYVLLERQPLHLPNITAKELMAINENARRALELYLSRLRMTEEEILRRDAIGESMENSDFTYEVVPDPDSPSETAVRVAWKLGRWEAVLGKFHRSDYGVSSYG